MVGQKLESAVPTNVSGTSSQHAVPRSWGEKERGNLKTNDLPEHFVETGELWGCEDMQGFLTL